MLLLCASSVYSTVWERLAAAAAAVVLVDGFLSASFEVTDLDGRPHDPRVKWHWGVGGHMHPSLCENTD